MPIRPNVINDLHDLRFEAHVEHAVSFVEDEIRNALEVGNAPRVRSQQVDHATRSTDDNFRTLLHLCDLVLDRRATVSAYSL